MSEKAFIEGFSEEEQEKYALEAEQMYDPETVRESNRKWKAYSAAKKEAILAEGKAIYMDMIAAMPKGAEQSGSAGNRRTLAQAYGLLLDAEPGSTARPRQRLQRRPALQSQLR